MKASIARCPICKTLGDKRRLSHHIVAAHPESQFAVHFLIEIHKANIQAVLPMFGESTPKLLEPTPKYPQSKVPVLRSKTARRTKRTTNPKAYNSTSNSQWNEDNKSSVATQTQSVQAKTTYRLDEIVSAPDRALGLGELSKSEGQPKSAPGGITLVPTKCSCRGENQNCFRCDGTGFYERAIVSYTSPNNLQNSSTRQEVTFSIDSRGGKYSIRENGRFESSPLEDDYDE